MKNPQQLLFIRDNYDFHSNIMINLLEFIVLVFFLQTLYPGILIIFQDVKILNKNSNILKS